MTAIGIVLFALGWIFASATAQRDWLRRLAGDTSWGWCDTWCVMYVLGFFLFVLGLARWAWTNML